MSGESALFRYAIWALSAGAGGYHTGLLLPNLGNSIIKVTLGNLSTSTFGHLSCTHPSDVEQYTRSDLRNWTQGDLSGVFGAAERLLWNLRPVGRDETRAGV